MSTFFEVIREMFPSSETRYRKLRDARTLDLGASREMVYKANPIIRAIGNTSGLEYWVIELENGYHSWGFYRQDGSLWVSPAATMMCTLSLLNMYKFDEKLKELL